MLKRFDLGHFTLRLLLDIACVIGAFQLANWLRQALPYGRVEFYPQGIPGAEVYIIGAVLWTLTALYYLPL